SLRDPGAHQLRYERGREGLVRRKPDGSLTRFVARELVRILGDRCRARVEGTVAGRGAEPDEHLPVEPEGGKLIADAFLGSRRRGLDGAAELLERATFVAR